MYFQTIVPLTMALYGASDVTVARMLFESRILLAGELIILLLLLRRAGPLCRDDLLLALAVFALGGVVTCLVQDKDWFYHRLPATILVWLGLIYWTAATLSAPQPAARRSCVMLAAAICAIGALGNLSPR